MTPSDNNRLSPNLLARILFESQFIENPECESPGFRRKTLRYWQGQFYIYREGRYYELPDSEIEVVITKFLQDCGEEVKENLCRSIRRNLAADAHIPREMQPDSWIHGTDEEMGTAIVMQNGILLFACLDEFGKPRLIQHSPVYFTLSKLPYDYKRFAECPKWFEFLVDVMDGDEERIMLLQQFAGYLLTSDLKEQKFLLCAGEGANGKTVFFTLMEMLVGRDNCTHVPLASFDRRFGLECTIGKKLNSINESGRKVSEAAEMTLKSYTSGDAITVDRKYKAAVSYVPTAKIMISTNTLPHFLDKTQGLWRRMLFVPFEKTIPEDQQDKDLVNELQEELPGIFNWAYEGMILLQKNRGFIGPKRCIGALEQYKREVNSARTFLEDNYIYDPGFPGVASAVIYDQYRTWCRQNGHQAVNSSNFGKEVKRVFPKSRKVRPEIVGVRRWSYRGLFLLPDAEVNDEVYQHNLQATHWGSVQGVQATPDFFSP